MLRLVLIVCGVLAGDLAMPGHLAFARTSPRAAVIVLPSPAQSFKYLYGRAFRAPNDGERVMSLRPGSRT